jgi:hypothetical protein
MGAGLMSRRGPQPIGRAIEALAQAIARQQQDLQQLLELVRQQNTATEALAALLTVMLNPPPRPWTLGLSGKMTVTFRQCTSCGGLKPLEDFYPRPNPSDSERRHRQCKDCMIQKVAARSSRGATTGGSWRWRAGIGSFAVGFAVADMGAGWGMLIVETIAKVRRGYFVQKKSIKAICRGFRLSRKVARSNETLRFDT